LGYLASILTDGRFHFLRYNDSPQKGGGRN
jgi:hypothetical protein